MIPYLKSLIVKLFTDLLNPLNKLFFGRHKVIQYGSYLKKESEQNYLRGKLHGLQRSWYSKKHLESCAIYEQGVCLEEKVWHYSGKLAKHHIYKDGVCIKEESWHYSVTQQVDTYFLYHKGVRMEEKSWFTSGQLHYYYKYIDEVWSTQKSWFENGNLHYLYKDKNGELWDHIIYYKNGQMRFEKREGLILNTWLEDGTQGVKDGNGIRIDYDVAVTHFDVQETVKDGKLNGYASYRFTGNKELRKEGYYKNNKKVGIWKEYKGAKLIDLDYDQEGTLSPEEEEYLAFKKFIEEQKKQENTNQK